MGKEREKSKKDFRWLAIPVGLVISMTIFLYICKLLNISDTKELIKVIEHYFSIYGYPVLFLSSLIESIPLINLYYPGSTIILMAAAVSHNGTLNLVAVIAVTSLAFMISYVANYFIGKHGWHHFFIKCGLGPTLDKSGEQVEKYGRGWIWLTYIHPNLGALTSTSYGILKLPFKRFFWASLAATVFWCTFWGFVAYLSYNKMVQFLAFRWFFVGIVCAYVLYVIVKSVRKNKQAKA
jgi:membrane protein DedA with SNARE-associated domain